MANELFYDRVASKLRSFLLTLLKEEPELRSVSVALDYQEALNNAAGSSAVWCGRGENGIVSEVAAISGSIQQTTRLLAVQIDRAAQLGQQIRARLEAVAKAPDGASSNQRDYDGNERQASESRGQRDAGPASAAPGNNRV